MQVLLQVNHILALSRDLPFFCLICLPPANFSRGLRGTAAVFSLRREIGFLKVTIFWLFSMFNYCHKSGSSLLLSSSEPLWFVNLNNFFFLMFKIKQRSRPLVLTLHRESALHVSIFFIYFFLQRELNLVFFLLTHVLYFWKFIFYGCFRDHFELKQRRASLNCPLE